MLMAGSLGAGLKVDSCLQGFAARRTQVMTL
ncbi:Uncharacterised protein [Mycobacteroides abscessus subsp. abscessus]|nr:Uncharacterised protein [Mycobacteroides abscessus subsp. abscessus]